MNERRSVPIHPEASDTESVFSDQSARSLITTRTAQFATSALADRSAMSVQSRVNVPASGPALSIESGQLSESVQASKSAPAGRSSRPVRSVPKSRSLDHTKPFECEECGKVNFLLMKLDFGFVND